EQRPRHDHGCGRAALVGGQRGGDGPSSATAQAGGGRPEAVPAGPFGRDNREGGVGCIPEGGGPVPPAPHAAPASLPPGWFGRASLHVAPPRGGHLCAVSTRARREGTCRRRRGRAAGGDPT